MQSPEPPQAEPDQAGNTFHFAHQDVRGCCADDVCNRRTSRNADKRVRGCPSGSSLHYRAAVNGHLHLVLSGKALEALDDDCKRMVEDGLLLEDAESFESLMDQCAELAKRANGAFGSGASAQSN